MMITLINKIRRLINNVKVVESHSTHYVWHPQPMSGQEWASVRRRRGTGSSSCKRELFPPPRSKAPSEIMENWITRGSVQTDGISYKRSSYTYHYHLLYHQMK